MNQIDKKSNNKFDEILRRLERCEAVTAQYESMFKQLDAKMKALDDRQGNIQALYDYMVKVGSTLVTKDKDKTARLMPNSDPKRLNDE
jgi:hypothetical protein